MTKIKPINKGILIEEITEDKTTKSGIVVVERRTVQSFKKGKVLATDSDIVSIGDGVIFSAYGPQRINIEPPAQYIAKECDILAIIQ